MRIPEQVQRLTIVVLAILSVVLLTRFVLIPPHLVSSELHRAATVERETLKQVRFAGSSACLDCHGDIAARKGKGFHKTLTCEACHGPSLQHAQDPGAIKPAAPRDRKFCPVCHAYDPSRPSGFPQVNPTAHNPLKPCITCHNPHDPTPPTAPRECSACHAQIERMKGVSSHALLECTTCHSVPKPHKTSPRSALPSKPATREFCGRCHAKEATAANDAPRVDMATHGDAYLCWECHYPHLPEGRP